MGSGNELSALNAVDSVGNRGENICEPEWGRLEVVQSPHGLAGELAEFLRQALPVHGAELAYNDGGRF